MFKRSRSKAKFLKVEPKPAEPEEKKVPTEFPEDDEDVPPPSIDINLEEQKFAILDFLKGLFISLLSPIVTAAISIGGANLSLVLGNKYLILLYPYMVALLNFVAALPALLGSFNSASSQIFSVIEKFMEAYDNAMNLYVEKVRHTHMGI